MINADYNVQHQVAESEDVMGLGFMVEKAIGMNNDMLVDLGVISEKETQERHQSLINHGIGKKNFCIEGYNRLLMRVPKSKAKNILEAFPMIKEGSTYWQTTHHWDNN